MKALLLSVILLSFVACKGSKSSSNVSTTNIDNYADTVEVSLNSISGATDDASNEAVIAQSSSILEKIINHSFINMAYAAACSRTLSNSSGVCTRNVNCEVGAYVWSGTAVLTFSNGASCSLGAMSEFFTRTIDFTRTGPRGSLQTTSATRTAYEGSSFGGGIRVTKADNGTAVDVDILGQHKILTRTGGATVYDMSFESPTALRLNQLARNGRVIASGVLDVYHNRAQFKTTHTATNLTYSSSCCYPVGGSIATTLTGSISGTGSVTFTSCGNFTATLNGQNKTYSMANCE